MNTKLSHKHCLVCASDNIAPLHDYQNSYLGKCTNCGFVFSTVVPTTEELKNHYKDSYDVTSYFSPITRKRYEELLEMFEPYRKTNKILDIGCGHGFFLEVAKSKGWDVTGLEPSEEGYAICSKKGIEVIQSGIEAADLPEGAFDVIISIEVIEHVIQPIIFVEQASRFLRSGGAMYVTTPNFNSYLRYQLKEKYDVIDYPTHLTYFTKSTLKRIFETNGFKMKSIKATGMSITRVKTSKQTSNQEFISETSDDEMLRHKIEGSIWLRGSKNVVNFGLSSLKLGNTLKGFFIKL